MCHIEIEAWRRPTSSIVKRCLCSGCRTWHHIVCLLTPERSWNNFTASRVVWAEGPSAANPCLSFRPNPQWAISRPGCAQVDYLSDCDARPSSHNAFAIKHSVCVCLHNTGQLRVRRIGSLRSRCDLRKPLIATQYTIHNITCNATLNGGHRCDHNLKRLRLAVPTQGVGDLLKEVGPTRPPNAS